MSFEKTFCPSPWFHMRITNSGEYKFCRWSDKSFTGDSKQSTKTITPVEFFQKNMSGIRKKIIAGETLLECTNCYQMEKYGKVSGRQRQLLKVGIHPDNFVKTSLSSTWIDHFSNSSTDLLPQDWQIDLGNFCNSGCIFCSPEDSSKLATEFKKLKIINRLPVKNWTDDPEQLSKFINTIKQSTAIKYIHFIGGETLITPAFKKILKELINIGINKKSTIGFTTNLYCWDQEAVDLLIKFNNVNLGVSVECFDKLNDYVRWPSKIEDVKTNFDKWLSLTRENNWSLQIRTTPTWLTVGKLLSVYDVAWDSGVSIESCNFLYRPESLQISVLPKEYRQTIVEQMKKWIRRRQDNINNSTVYNIRNLHTVNNQIVQDLESYVNYLENSEYQVELLPNAIEYLKLLESNRNNSILDYLPEYEELFRSAGY
jgi:hypothetical protein